MQKLDSTPKTMFFGLTVTYFTGILVILLIFGISKMDKLNPLSSKASTGSLADKCLEPGADWLAICNPASLAVDNDINDGNLVRNGSFEMPVIFGQSQFIPTGAVGQDWSVAWASPGLANRRAGVPVRPATLELRTGEAAKGQQYAELDTYSYTLANAYPKQSLVKIGQYVPTSGGNSYTLSFRFAPGAEATSEDACMQVTWGGVPIAQIMSKSFGLSWQYFSYTVTSRADRTLLEFAGCGPENGLGSALDDIMVVRS